MTALCWLGLTNTEFSLCGRQADCLLPQGGMWLPATSPALHVLMRQKGLGCSERQNRGGGDGADDQPAAAVSQALSSQAPVATPQGQGAFWSGSGRLRP